MKMKSTLLFVIAALVFSSCSKTKEKAEREGEKHEAPAVVETFVLKKGTMDTDFKVPAELTAYREVDLYAKVTSYVQSLHADVGTLVRKGQVLATLEAPELVFQLAASESKYKAQEALYLSSKATYDRIFETSKTPGTISKNDVDIALAKMTSDKAQFDAARSEYQASSTILQYLNITAPFDGVISARNVNLGAYLGPSGKGSELPIFTLHELNHLRLIISIPETYRNYVRLNDTVHFTVQAFQNQVFTAKIARRAGVMDKRLRSEHIELDIDNSDLRLSPGMVGEATISLTSGTQTYIVPKTAVINSSEGIFLIADDNGTAKKVRAKLGRVTDTSAEVFGDDIREGSVYVKKASEEIRDGSKL